jgi:cellulose synthase/poly-beta-1,6-N-acetylglucosamine synthase-like glycosyltransferase
VLILLLLICLFLLGYIYAGYAAIMRLWARVAPHPAAVVEEMVPQSVSFVIVARNEEQRIRQRIRNLQSLHLPPQSEILVACDGCEDRTAAAAAATECAGVRVLEFPRSGKPACLNAAVAAAQHEIVVFADARQEFAPDAAMRLLRVFGDPAVGAASGALEIAPSQDPRGRGLDSYWSIEKKLRRDESLVDSCIGCTGAIYAVRRSLYRPAPNDTMIDDVVIPLLIAEGGHRIVFVPEAVAWDPQRLEAAIEKRRKERTLAGNFQLLFRHARWLAPGGHRLWFGILSHKILRLAGPILLAAVLLLNILLRDVPVVNFLLWAQIAFYAAGILTTVCPRAAAWFRPAALPGAFLFLQVSIVRGFIHYLRVHRSGKRGW